MKYELEKELIQVRHLTKHFPVRLGAYGQQTAVVHAVDDVSFTIAKGETLGLVGESGCGKSTTGFNLLQLYKPTRGSVKYLGEDLTQMKESDLHPLRKKLQIIFQDPYSTLNPRMTIGAAIVDPMIAHKMYTKKEACERMAKLLEDVGLSPEYASLGH